MAQLRFESVRGVLFIACVLLPVLACTSHQNTSGPGHATQSSSGKNTIVIGGENTGSTVNGNNLNIVQDNGSLLISGKANSSGALDANGAHYEVHGSNRLE